MRVLNLLVVAACAVTLSLGSARGEPAGSGAARSGGLPDALAVPAGNDLVFELQAEGVQVYACAGSDGKFAWTFRAPEAALFGPEGQPAGRHYAGPSWESSDGSKVVGAKVESATPDPASIPWLLLRSSSHTGSGRMEEVTFIQRVRTSGGNAPSDGCDAAHAGATARVPYRAAYRFYRQKTGTGN